MAQNGISRRTALVGGLGLTAADRRAFDGAADFAPNDVLSGILALRDVPSYIAYGSSDPFEPMDGVLRSRLRRLTGREPAGGIEAGCHDNAFWARHFPGALAFVGAHLAYGPPA